MPDILKALKVETKSETETESVIGIKTLLDTISITLQYRREKDQKSQSKQRASIILLIVLRETPGI